VKIKKGEIGAAAAAAGMMAPGANPDAMAVEGPQRGQALRPNNAAAAAASSVMQLKGAQRAGGRVVNFVQGSAATAGRPDTFDFTAQKMDIANSNVDAENKIQGGGGPFVGGGSRIGRSRSRGPPLSDIDSSSNIFNSYDGPSSARGPPSAVVMRKFPTTLSYRSREIVSATKSGTMVMTNDHHLEGAGILHLGVRRG